MRRIRLVLAIPVAIVTMVLFFSAAAMAYGPRGLIGEGRVDIREGHRFIEEGQVLITLGQPVGAQRVARGHHAIREGRADVRKGQRGIGGH